MLAREDNERLTRVGPGTPMGELMRRYWIPTTFAHHIAKPDSPPVRVKLMGERLVAFRDTQGRVGLLDERCPHRTASLFFGRNEDCGLRCVYHGWKFDIDGNCVDMPSEPKGGSFQARIKAKAYPCLERGGVVWAYLGPPEHKPEFPDLEWTRIPASQRHSSRHVQECNWLQGLEGGFDTSHLSFLHKGVAEKHFDNVPMSYEVVPTDFGFVVGTGREQDDETFWTANVMLMPFHKIIASALSAAHVWAPMDDENTMLYSVDFHPSRPLTDADLARSRSFRGIHTENIPGTDRAVQNRGNDYLIDRALQASGESFTGMRGLGIQDCAIQESMGPVADRTIEHLGGSDAAIVKIRRLLLQTLKDHAAGKPLPGTDPASYRVRSARFKAPSGASFAEAMNRHVRVGALATTE
ncbi:MAG: phthalate 4,5-dioxygenase [Alphaproteobacteria bacterium]|jgi:nitrite reductase/ring-hydroxylating ferredoxin subunit|nr:phthalate 4,5-dioxygenase [Alphaproteobacteria bacterium]